MPLLQQNADTYLRVMLEKPQTYVNVTHKRNHALLHKITAKQKTTKTILYVFKMLSSFLLLIK
jgi:hypothetical protein